MTQAWTRENLRHAARLYRLGVAPREIAAEIGVSLKRLTWTIGHRDDLFSPKGGRKAKAAAPQAPRPITPSVLLISSPARGAGRPSTYADPPVAPTPTAYLPGIDAQRAGRPKAPGAGPVDMMGLGRLHCRWMLEMDGGPAGLFCGDAVVEGRSWCACHLKRVTQRADAAIEEGA